MTYLHTDKKLLELCDEYGKKALFWRQKFIGLLPEVAERKLYLKAGSLSIFEFAKKKAGLSEKQVTLTLNLHERFEDKPVLKNMLVVGEVSINKLARVASVATCENQEFWAEQTRVLPKKSLETLVRDERIMAGKVLPGQKGALQLSPELSARLMEMQRKKIDVNEFLMKLLDKHEEEFVERKDQAAEECEEKAGMMSVKRYIPVKIRKLLHEEFGRKCAIPHCYRESQSMHHTARFAVSHSHNPHYLAPLCKEHHDIAHAVDRRVNKTKLKYQTAFPYIPV